MAWIGLLYSDISNFDGISISINPSFGSFNEPSPIFIIQEENSSISAIVDYCNPFRNSRMFFVKFIIWQ